MNLKAMKLLGPLSLALSVAFTAAIAPSPVLATGGDKAITAKALDNYSCNDNEWHFVITQINSEASAPDRILVQWDTNGDKQADKQELVSRDAFTGKVAHYATSSHLGGTVIKADTLIYDGWRGQFNLSHGPCAPNQQIPFAPAALAYPAIGALTFGAAYGVRRLRARATGPSGGTTAASK